MKAKLYIFSLLVMFVMTACGGEKNSDSNAAKINKKTNATLLDAANAKYILRINQLKDNRITYCTIAGEFVNNSDENLSIASIKFDVKYSETAEQVIDEKRVRLTMVHDAIYGKQDGLIAAGATVPISRKTPIVCDDVGSLKLEYFNCAGANADGSIRGIRCSADMLIIENNTRLPLER